MRTAGYESRDLFVIAATTVLQTVAIIADANAAGVLTVDQTQYLASQTVTFTGTGWEDCEFDSAVNLIGTAGLQFIGLFTHQDGVFSRSFPAPADIGTYLLGASGDQDGCVDQTIFDVVEALPSTTTTPTTTTSEPEPTTTVAATTSAPTTTNPAPRSIPTGALPATGNATPHFSSQRSSSWPD